MEIFLISAAGIGDTQLSAFDNALTNAGVLNYNLIRLSSVIPPDTVIREIEKYDSPQLEWGYKLYVVQAEQHSIKKKQSIACGIGWYIYENQKGVFVEHETVAETEQQAKQTVQQLITLSLRDLCANRGYQFDEKKIGMKTIATTVVDKPTCVLTLAIYKSEAW